MSPRRLPAVVVARFGWPFGSDVDECEDVPWDTVTGLHWLSLLDDGEGSDELVAAGGTVQCEGD